ncbi:MAG: hypothetical protein AMS15_06115 [Planctomycetes bacterium DG_23]|nr:MAG: hypothetical protein AMS15_06115 [Planctomycetes bacterium DG_23]
MFFKLILLFTITPIVELAILIKLGQEIGLLPTLAIVIATGILGASLAKWQGWGVIRRIREDLENARMPAQALFDGLLILVGGALLLTPGIITDLAGFFLLIPPGRRLVQTYLKRRFKKSIETRFDRF